MSLQSDFTVISFLICYNAILLQWKIKGSTYSLKQLLMQLQSELTMAVVTERTKNSSSACSNATIKMPSGALTLNTGLLGYNLYIYSIRADHVLFDLPVPLMVLEGKGFIRPYQSSFPYCYCLGQW